MCVVEVKGARNLVASCVHPVAEGMEVQTNTPKLLDSRRRTLELLLSNHDKKCLSCVRSGQCELQELCQELGVTDENYFEGETTHYELVKARFIWCGITTNVSFAGDVLPSVKKCRA